MTDDTSAVRRNPWPRRITLVVVCLLGLIVLAGAWVGIRGLMAKSELEALLPLAEPLKAAAADRDLAAIDELASEVQTHAGRAADLTGDPVWRAAEILPVVGPNLAAVRTLSAELDSMTSAAGPVLDLALEASGGSEDGFDVGLLTSAREPLAAASVAFTDADERLAAIDTDPLVGPVERGVDTIAGFAGEAAPVIASAAQAAEVLPGMLGADGRRSILVILQNNAEVRTGGGLTGSFVLLGAEDGNVSMVAQADSTQFPQTGSPILPVPESTTELYGEDVGGFVQNASMPADFELTADLARAWWTEYIGEEPDAVVSIDVPVIASLLAVSGPVILPDGSAITSENLLDRMLVEPYMTLGSEEQTGFQRMVTTAALNGILMGDTDPIAWMHALAEPIEEGRIAVWSAVPAEEAILSASTLGGPAVRHALSPGTTFAAYLNDATAAKMDSFLDVAFATGTAQCRPDGLADIVVTATLTNTAPADAGATWSEYMTGGGFGGFTPGDIATDVVIAAPPGSTVSEVRLNGELVLAANVEDAGFPSSRARVTLSPGSTGTLEFRFVAAEPGEQSVTLLHTPLMHKVDVGEAVVTCG
ncbi:MAG: DUF4012 domain-containing protein [Microbacterium sp.]